MTRYETGRVYAGSLSGVDTPQLLIATRHDGFVYARHGAWGRADADQVADIRGPFILLDLPAPEDTVEYLRRTTSFAAHTIAHQIEEQVRKPLRTGVYEVTRRAPGSGHDPTYLWWDGAMWRHGRCGTAPSHQDWTPVQFIGSGPE